MSFASLAWFPSSAHAAPAAPNGAHPRIWLTAPTVAALTKNMGMNGTAAAAIIAKCKDVVAKPSSYDDAVYEGYGWGYASSACAMAWRLTKNPAYATAAERLWKALLYDYQTVGDGAGGDTAEQHDSGYGMRYFGTYVALDYDWLHDAPGADALLQTSRARMKTWVEWYETSGYLKGAPGSNYHAGYILAKTMIAIAASGEDDGSAARYWTDVVDNMWQAEIIGKGLGTGGPLVSGDWPEGWEYGQLGVLEYAMSARAVEEQGAALPDAHTFVDGLALDYEYALTPDQQGFYVGGDLGTGTINALPGPEPLLAIMAGPGSDEAAGWSSFLHANVVTTQADGLIYEALAEARGATATSYTAGGASSRTLSYVTRGTRKLYARSSFDPAAFWGVFVSAPKFGVDHQHLDASTFVLSRGKDSLVADPSPYGSLSTLTGNALSVDSTTVQEDYRPSQSPYSTADLPWARGTTSGVAAARAELANAFADSTGKSDVPFARRDWAFLPEGEIVTIDRVRTDDAARKTYLRFRSPAKFTIDAHGVATAVVAGSQLVVHPVTISPATAPKANFYKGDPGSPCDSGSFGVCTAARFDAGEYAMQIAGPTALAVHVLDALGAGEAPADAVAMGDPAVVGAEVTRASVRTFVLASSAKDGAVGPTFAYAAAGDMIARHVVFDAPEDANGMSNVTAHVAGATCAVSITAGAGANAFAGRPLVFQLSAAKDGCTTTEDKPAPPATVTSSATTDGGIGPSGSANANGAGAASADGTEVTGHCGCGIGKSDTGRNAGLALGGAAFALGLARARRRPRRDEKGRH